MRLSDPVSITLPPDLLAYAKELARTERRTVSELVYDALQRYAEERQEKKNYGTLLRIQARAVARDLCEEDVALEIAKVRHELWPAYKRKARTRSAKKKS